MWLRVLAIVLAGAWSTTLPAAPVLDQFQDAQDQGHSVNNAEHLAQGFLHDGGGLGLPYLAEIWVGDFVHPSDTYPLEISVEIRQGTAVDPTPLTLVHSEDLTITEAPADGWLKFVFSSPLILSLETAYTFVLKGAAGNTGTSVVGMNSAGGYGGLGLIMSTSTDGGTNWNYQGFVKDMRFRTYSLPVTGLDVPLGFQVLGTVVPPVYENPNLYGFAEVFPPTNTTEPTWTPTETARGYVAYVKNYLDKVYPRTRPLPSREEITDELNMFSPPGEYEPATFTLYALAGNTLSNVSVSVSDLTGPAGGTIAARNIEVRSVRCWPRRTATASTYEMAPWFLEKRSTLTIPPETSQRYWITVRVPDGAAAGSYHGTVTIEVANHDNYALHLALDVPDIELLRPPRQHGMYYNIINNQLYTGQGDYYPDAYYFQEVMNMKEHGMTTAWIFNPEFTGFVDGGGDVVFDLDPIAPFTDACMSAGFDPLIWNMTIGPILPGFSGPSANLGENFRGFVDGHVARGWTLPILSHGDETDAKGGGFYQACTNYLATSKQYVPEAKTYTTIVWPHNSELFEPNLDIRTFSSWTDTTAIAPTRAAGRELWMYTGADRGAEINRLNRGWFAAKMTLDGLLDWVYFGYPPDPNNPFDDLVGSVRGSVLPGLGGPLPTADWEGSREGIEDGKYIYTLEQLIAEAGASGDPNLVALAANAQDYLDSLYAQIWTGPVAGVFPVNHASTLLDADFYDSARVSMAGHIETILAAQVNGTNISQATEFLDINQPLSNTIWGGVDKQSQSFVTGPTTEFITAIEYQTWNPNGIGDAATLTLRNFNTAGTNPDPDWETGTLLATKSETFVGATDGGWLRFEFDIPVDVTPGGLYTFFVQVTAGPSGFYRQNAGADVYPPGANKRFVTPSGWDNDGFDSDLAFRVYGYTEFPVVFLEVGVQESVALCFTSQQGKVYWLQATTDLVTSSNWETVGATIAGDGGVKYLFDPTEPTGASTSKRYRILGN